MSDSPDSAAVDSADHAVAPLRRPAEGIPDIVASPAALRNTATALQAGSGPIAVDAERASGHRYDQRAYLIQLRREGSGTHLIDPVPLGDTTLLANALSEAEWILHAATQDLPCLRELGLQPPALFDTELAGRLLGLPRVGLAGMTEDLLGIGLAKQHSAADWSRRPLPADWLAYAALDVELLVELRAVLIDMLQQADRWDWAQQEFTYLLTWQPQERPDPWRRVSGVSRLNDRRDLAIARELWQTRDTIAQRADQPPGRILPNAAIIAAVKAAPTSTAQLKELPEFRNQRRSMNNWWRAIERGRTLPESELPPRKIEGGVPHHRHWGQRNPPAAQLLAPVRQAIADHAQELGITHEVLVSPEAVRTLVWQRVGQPADEVAFAEQLAEQQVRDWQIEHVLPLIVQAWQSPE